MLLPAVCSSSALDWVGLWHAGWARRTANGSPICNMRSSYHCQSPTAHCGDVTSTSKSKIPAYDKNFPRDSARHSNKND